MDTVFFAWTASDPDGDDLTHGIAVYQDAALDTLVGAALTLTSPSAYITGLSYSHTYYWYVWAMDDRDTTVGPVWSFTTMAPPILTLMSEDFDALDVPNSNWVTGDLNATSGFDYWDNQLGTDGARLISSPYSLYCADVSDQAGQFYDDDMFAYFERAASAGIDLTGYTNIQLSFWLWYDTEFDFDFVSFQYWNGLVWVEPVGGRFTGTSGGWVQQTVDFFGSGILWIRWVFVSDESVTDEGAYLDDILLTAQPTGSSQGDAIMVNTTTRPPLGARGFTPSCPVPKKSF